MSSKKNKLSGCEYRKIRKEKNVALIIQANISDNNNSIYLNTVENVAERKL